MLRQPFKDIFKASVEFEVKATFRGLPTLNNSETFSLVLYTSLEASRAKE